MIEWEERETEGLSKILGRGNLNDDLLIWLAT